MGVVELAKAQAAAVLPAIDVQISKCKEVMERSEWRLVWLEGDFDREGGFVRGASPFGQIG